MPNIVELKIPIYLGTITSNRVVKEVSEVLRRNGVPVDRLRLTMPNPGEGKVEQRPTKVN